MLGYLLCGIGLSISLLLFQGLSGTMAVARVFNDLSPYILNNCVMVTSSLPEPYFSETLIKQVLTVHFANLNASVGRNAYRFEFEVGEFLSARRYPQYCEISLNYRSIIGDYDYHKAFRIQEGMNAQYRSLS